MCWPCSDGPTDASPPDASILCSRRRGAPDPLPPGTGLGSGSAPHHRLQHGHPMLPTQSPQPDTPSKPPQNT